MMETSYYPFENVQQIYQGDLMNFEVRNTKSVAFPGDVDVFQLFLVPFSAGGYGKFIPSNVDKVCGLTRS